MNNGRSYLVYTVVIGWICAKNKKVHEHARLHFEMNEYVHSFQNAREPARELFCTPACSPACWRAPADKNALMYLNGTVPSSTSMLASNDSNDDDSSNEDGDSNDKHAGEHARQHACLVWTRF